ncbi:MAG: hypothetical protein R2795_02400 [Saprospiraceae bacterium]
MIQKGAVFLVVLWSIFFPVRVNSDCGPGFQGFYGYSFINPKVTAFDANLAPFFLDMGQIYADYFKSQGELYVLDNVQEWRERYCENATLDDIRYIVYTASQYQLEDLRAVIDNPNANLNMLGGIMATNSWARYMVRHGCRETVDYLIFAKQCEPHVTLPANAWQAPRRDYNAMQTLIRQAKERFLRTESDYIKLRYAFQAIRLAHYMQDYEQTLALTEYYLPKIDNDPSIVEYWIMGHKAGAMQALGRKAEAAYLFSRVFEKCPGKRESAFRSFRIDTDEEWEQCLLLCRNDHERAGLYVLRASGKNARLTEEMQHIYDYDPRHPALEMLLVRELQRLEKDLLGNSFNPQAKNNQQRFNIPREQAGERVIALQALVRKWLKQRKIAQPALWKLAEGYLEVLAGNYYFAEKTLALAEDMVDTKPLKEQLSVFRLVLKIMMLNKVSAEQEVELAALGKRYDFYEHYPDFPKLIRDKLRTVYVAQGDEAKAYLMQYSLAQLRANPDLDIINDLLALCRKEDRSPYEKALVEREDGTTIEYDLVEAKSAYLLGMGEPEAALSAMRDIPSKEWDNFGQFNPFIRRFADCVNCKLPDTVTTYNRGELIERLLDLEFKARAAESADEAASLYFQLGEAYYNMSYYGPAWKATDLFRSSASAASAYHQKGKEVFPHPGLPLGNHENFDIKKAWEYFDQARRTARSIEIQAAATYMAAKCERNRFYTSGEKRTFDYFTMLQKDYQQTEFYQRVIQECRDFQAFVLK